MAESSQPNPTPDGGTSTTTAEPKSTAAPQAVDLTKLEGEELNKVLENPNLFKLPRIAEALDAQKALKKLQDQNSKANEDKLKEEKKFEELSTQQSQTIEGLKKQLQDNEVNQALTGLLVKESVVDLDGALKLVDRSKIVVDENGTITGVEDAFNALKTDKAYLFSGTPKPNVGTPSNSTNSTAAPQGQYKFKESQLTPDFYQAHKAEIDLAGKQGLIEPDGPPR